MVNVQIYNSKYSVSGYRTVWNILENTDISRDNGCIYLIGNK